MLVELSKVTRALVTLLREVIPSASGTAPVSPLPYEQLPAGSLGVFLYHITEAAHLKNQVPPGPDYPPVRFTPMGLSLYYQITARGADDSEPSLYTEQDLIGYAAKALHDYPTIDDATVIGINAPVLQDVGLDNDDNRLRISLQPMPYNEATNFWSAGNIAPRLALYYEVSVILLTPPKPTTVTGRVLSFGVDAFVRGAPFLDGSENALVVTVPSRQPNKIVVRPAQVPIGPLTQGVSKVPSIVSFTGYNLAGDTSTSLLLRGGKLTGTVEADPGWSVAASKSIVQASVLATIGGQTVLPGVYTAIVRTATRVNGELIVVSSNETPFTITPRIDSTVVTSGPVVQVAVLGSPFADPQLEPDDLGVYVTGVRYVVYATPGTVPAGAYRIDGPTLITIGLLPLPTGPTPLRINVLGTQSPPIWITI